jgi:hypothetical protein
MPYEMSWLKENRIIFVRVYGKFTVKELALYEKELTSYLDASTVPLVHVIGDLTGSIWLPGLKHLVTLPSGNHPRLGWAIIVGTMNPVERTLLRLTAAFFRLRFRVFASMEDIIPFLQQMDPTLPAMEETA